MEFIPNSPSPPRGIICSLRSGIRNSRVSVPAISDGNQRFSQAQQALGFDFRFRKKRLHLPPAQQPYVLKVVPHVELPTILARPDERRPNRELWGQPDLRRPGKKMQERRQQVGLDAEASV